MIFNILLAVILVLPQVAQASQGTPAKFLPRGGDVEGWTEQTILIPSEAYSSTCYFAFMATTNHGPGVCIDDVTFVEAGVLERHLDTLTIHQLSTDLVASGSTLNQMIRIDLSVKGNSGEIKLNSLNVNSLNTTDEDIPTNGVKLLYPY